MKKVMKYPIYPITFSYVNGIFFGLYFQSYLNYYLILTLLSFILFLIYKLKRAKTFSNYNTVITLCFIFFVFSALGFLNYKIRNNYVNLHHIENSEITLIIKDNLKANAYNNRAYANAIVENKEIKVLFQYPKTDIILTPGTIVKTVGNLKPIADKKNPYDFDYKTYLKNKRIYYQVETYSKPIVISYKKSLLRPLYNLQHYITSKIKELGYNPKTTGFIEGLLFGNKNNLDSKLQEQFKNLGILHILAVSGMHVVLLFATIQFILGLFRTPKSLVSITLVLFLLIFCFLTGFTGSVVRAAIMCLMVMYGKGINRTTNTITILIGSMLLILLFEPNYLFDVGFQLSYLAVFSIAYGYPIIKPYITFKNTILNYFTQIIGISIVAQLGVLPLSIYYFNQVPLLFLLGNIIAIPLTSILLIGWFIQLILAFIYLPLSTLITKLLQPIATLCFNSIETIESIFKTKTLTYQLNEIQLIIITTLIFCTIWAVYEKSIKGIFLVLLLIIGLQTEKIYRTKENTKSELVVFYDTKQLVLANNTNTNLSVYNTNNKKSYLENYETKLGKKITFNKKFLNNHFTLNNETWLYIDSLSIIPKRKFKRVIITHNAKINIDRLIAYTNPAEVILHSTNANYLNKEYEEKLDAKKIPYYNMRNKGAYIHNYN